MSVEKDITVCVSGYFNPLTVGHLEYFRLSKTIAQERALAETGDASRGKLLVIVNNDAQSCLKKGYTFMPEAERVRIVQSLRDVDHVVLSVDTDRTVCATLRMLASGTDSGHLAHRQVFARRIDVFANGGDQFNSSIPEAPVCAEFGIELLDGLGAKIQSSSWLIEGALLHAQAAATQKTT